LPVKTTEKYQFMKKRLKNVKLSSTLRVGHRLFFNIATQNILKTHGFLKKVIPRHENGRPRLLLSCKNPQKNTCSQQPAASSQQPAASSQQSPRGIVLKCFVRRVRKGIQQELRLSIVGEKTVQDMFVQMSVPECKQLPTLKGFLGVRATIPVGYFVCLSCLSCQHHGGMFVPGGHFLAAYPAVMLLGTHYSGSTGMLKTLCADALHLLCAACDASVFCCLQEIGQVGM
jgi:hypothetical protein